MTGLASPGDAAAGGARVLLDRRAGWRADLVLSVDVRWTDGPLTLAPLPGAPQPLADPTGSFGGLHEPLGVAAGPGGDVVILDRSGTRVLRFDACTGTFAPFACLERGWLRGARGLAVTDLGDLVVADPGARRVLVVTGDGRAIRRVVGPLRAVAPAAGRPWSVRPVEPQWAIPPDGTEPQPVLPPGTWEPWGVAAGCNRLVVTDRVNSLVHLFDERGSWRATTDGAGPPGSGVGPLAAPTAVALDRDGRSYVIQEGVDSVRVLDVDGVGVADVETLDDARDRFCPVAVAVAPDGTLCVAALTGALCLPAVSENCATAAGLDVAVRGLAFDREGRPLVVDGRRNCVVRLRDGAGYPREGRFVTEPLDSEWPGMPWHRVLVAGCLPPGTSVRVDTFTADVALAPAELAALPDDRWVRGPVLGVGDDVGGGVLPALGLVSTSGARPERWRSATTDMVVRSAPGRYLWLAVTLVGDGSATPVIDHLEVELPRRSSLRYLPPVYAAEPVSADFVDRFLSLFDTMRRSVTDHLDDLPRLFDPLAVPAGTGEPGRPDFLTWLAHWVGMATDAGLPVARRRALVREAAALYERWGTPDGVERFVGLFCGAEARVLEHHRLRRWAIGGRARLGDTSRLFGAAIVKRLQLDVFSSIGDFQLVDVGDPLHDPFRVHAHRFTVFLAPRDPGAEAEAVARLAALAIQQAKPAHTEADVVVVLPRMRVGQQSTIGLDTVIAAVPPPARLGDALDCGVVLGGQPVPAGAMVVG
jgi:phage tail-like protein